jgi:hypothetical protein
VIESAQFGGWHLLATQALFWQSAADWQGCPVAHKQPPPQSTATSSPFFKPSTHVGSAAASSVEES